MANPDYVRRNRDFLTAKAQEPGVTDLGCSVLCKVLRRGRSDAPSPNRSSVVTVHYTGRTINGKTFDSSRSGTAPAFRLRDLIAGWNIALTKMHPGDRWEIYIPAEQGYGKMNQPGIPGGSTLVFDIELIAVS